MIKFAIRASHQRADSRRYFLMEAPDERIARAVFMVERNGWMIELSGTARCFASGDHRGDLSVWEGREGKTAILCQHHGENPPSVD
jgi:hypothetical protein